MVDPSDSHTVRGRQTAKMPVRRVMRNVPSELKKSPSGIDYFTNERSQRNNRCNHSKDCYNWPVRVRGCVYEPAYGPAFRNEPKDKAQTYPTSCHASAPPGFPQCH